MNDLPFCFFFSEKLPHFTYITLYGPRMKLWGDENLLIRACFFTCITIYGPGVKFRGGDKFNAF